jgi:methenyltetrahydrofolate cyclohydrolase
MAALGSRQVREALAALASGADPPAAGVASALACAAAAALVELTSRLAADRLKAEGVSAKAESAARLRSLAARAGESREELLAAADEDVRAYTRVMEATDGAARAAALANASEPPLAIAECAAEVAEGAAETGRAGAWAFTADAVVAGKLAAAAAESCAELVAVDLAGRGEDPRIARARAAADRARRASLGTGIPPPD